MNDSQRIGWVRLYRASLDSSVWPNSIVWQVWCWCLLKAGHKEKKFPFNGGDIILQPGEFISSHDSALKELTGDFSTQKLRTAFKYLKSTGRITIKSNNKFSIISICNWEKYQSDNRQDNKPLTGQQQASNKPLTTNKNDKNIKKGKNENNNTPLPPEGEELVKYGAVMQMTTLEFEKLINQFTLALLQQELHDADEWLVKSQTPNARKYRKPDHNHYLFFKGWLSKKTLRTHKVSQSFDFNMSKREQLLALEKEGKL